MENNQKVIIREVVVARAIEHLKKELDAIDRNKDLSWEEVVAIVKGFGAWMK
jgi:hypothetical protein